MSCISAIQRFPQTINIQKYFHFYHVTNQFPAVPFGWHKLSQRYKAPKSKIQRWDSAVLKGGMAAFKAKSATAVLPTQFSPDVCKGVSPGVTT